MEQELWRLGALRAGNGTDCGDHLAAACSSCSDCGGECISYDDECIAVSLGNERRTYLAPQHAFSPWNDSLAVLAPAGSVAGAVLAHDIAGASLAGRGPEAPALCAAPHPERGHSGGVSARAGDGCPLPAAASNGSSALLLELRRARWRLARLAGGAGPARSAAAGHGTQVAPAAPAAPAVPAAEDGRSPLLVAILCSPADALSEFLFLQGAACTEPRECVSRHGGLGNAMARSLIAAAHGEGAIARKCASIGVSARCPARTLLTLAKAALLRLSFFGIRSQPAASAALLRHTLGLALPAGGRGWDPRYSLQLPAAAVDTWATLNRVDVDLFRYAQGVFSYRLRDAAIAVELPTLPALPNGMKKKLRSARHFSTYRGPGHAATVETPPQGWRLDTDTLIFIHIAKTGGTSFNKRLVTLRRPDGTRLCSCRKSSAPMHNGHQLVDPRSCVCPRDAGTNSLKGRTRNFLQRQWLLSPETSGWLGGVHSPVRVVQEVVMRAANLSSDSHLAARQSYVTILREPLSRFISEFYETYDGWESKAKYGTVPFVTRPCSSLLPPELARRALAGIDVTPKEKYDELFPFWLDCAQNQASNRQTRALSFYPPTNEPKRRKQELYECTGMRSNDAAGVALCDRRVAKQTLLQFAFIGIAEARCESERLFEAQFGLLFPGDPGGADRGRGAHMAELSFGSLPDKQQRRVRELNSNDLVLYAEALAIFNRRLRYFGIKRCTPWHFNSSGGGGGGGDNGGSSSSGGGGDNGVDDGEEVPSGPLVAESLSGTG